MNPKVSCLLQSHYQAGANEKNLVIINSDRVLELSVFGGTIEEEYEALDEKTSLKIK